jgi:predicted  nucleic acid-binding Zn-ribbon protein
MIIKRITIKNFRSYYGEQSFEFSNHLNLILGANGDGKTTLFDAISWVFATDGRNSEMTSSSLVSQKFFSSLPPAGSGEVMVSASVRHLNHDYMIERSFFVTKEMDGKMKISDPRHIGYMSIPGVSRKTAPAHDIIERKGLFPAVIKKYCLFKGESELNIFKDQKTLINLINLFSEVKDFDPYKDFSSYAEGLTDQARKNAKIKDERNALKADEIKAKTKEKETQLLSLVERRKDWKQSYSDYDKWISDLENSRDTIELVHGLQDSINTKETEKRNLEVELDENYSIKLLDDYWILYGFKPIIEEYAAKAQQLSEEREKLKNEFQYAQLKKKADNDAKKEALEILEKEFSQLPWFIPDINTMKEMLDEHRCKVCGTYAPQGSAPYNFMLKRLQEAIAQKKGETNDKTDNEENKEETNPILFVNDYINPLRRHSISFYGFDTEIEQIGSVISGKIEDNDKIHDKINEISHKIQECKNKINEIIAQSASGVDASSYYDLFNKLTNWSRSKEETNNKIIDADRRIPELKKEIEVLNKEYNKYISKEGQVYASLYTFFSLLSKSLDRAEASSFDEFLEKLKKEANKYISVLNVDDFTGIVDIYNNGDGKVFLQLVDKNGKIVEHPNTSLETTMHISILLAISELTKKERDNEYPLIFDAPTSTFDEGKDTDFYACLNSKVEKQCIVVTKSFLIRDKEGEFDVDAERLNSFDCPIYRIKKKSGFDQKDLTTIETIVEPYNNRI